MKTLDKKQFEGIIEKINDKVNYEFDSKFAVVFTEPSNRQRI